MARVSPETAAAIYWDFQDQIRYLGPFAPKSIENVFDSVGSSIQQNITALFFPINGGVITTTYPQDSWIIKKGSNYSVNYTSTDPLNAPFAEGFLNVSGSIVSERIPMNNLKEGFLMAFSDIAYLDPNLNLDDPKVVALKIFYSSALRASLPNTKKDLNKVQLLSN